MSDHGSEGREEVALADTAVTRKGERVAALLADLRDAVEPFGHHVRGDVGKIICRERICRIGNEILEVPVGPDLNQVFDFLLYASHRASNWSVGEFPRGREWKKVRS